MRTVKVGICGLGTVGSGTYKLLQDNAREIAGRAGCEITVGRIGARRDNPDCETGDTPVSRDIFEVARDPDIDVVVELIGGTNTALAQPWVLGVKAVFQI